MTTTIIAPTPLIAVNFILRRIISRMGPSSSHRTPKAYIRISIACVHTSTPNPFLAALSSLIHQIIVFVVPGLGAATAASSHRPASQNLASYMMLCCLILQLVACLLDSRPPVTVGAIGFSTLVLSIRCIYRIVGLADYWNGYVLDSGMVLLVLFTMNITHLGLLLETESGKDGDYDRTPTSPKEIP
ncbi:hypothetical protein B0H19DRAFT_1072527 [Mycena capillaripes]|nr:hypothetical protein B0H19DRAFT_1072527 [Mycena capillaripes]